MRVQIKVNNASETVSRYEVEQGAGAKGQGLRIDMRGQKHVNFELINEQSGFGPENIATKRVGSDLHVAFEQSDIGTPDLVIEGYYEDTFDHGVMGRAEDGLYYHYVPESGVQSDAISRLGENVLAGQALGGERYAGALWLPTDSFLPMALVGGALLLGGAAAAGGGGGGGCSAAPAAAAAASSSSSSSSSSSGT